MEYSHIAQALLGETFTLAELRTVHEAVLRRPLDPANFRRQMEASGTIVPTEAVVSGGRHRPPRLFRYSDTGDIAGNGRWSPEHPSQSPSHSTTKRQGTP